MGLLNIVWNDGIESERECASAADAVQVLVTELLMGLRKDNDYPDGIDIESFSFKLERG